MTITSPVGGAPLSTPAPPTAATKPGRTRRTARGPYHMRCVACDAEFTTIAAEDRHLAANPHYRYELVL